ncbi:hypothetical protein ABPG74_007875 [Tetrahymena malaccensis]
MNDLNVIDQQQLYRFQQQQLDSNPEDKLCFNDIFEDNLTFGIILCILVLVFMVQFIWLIIFWNQRKFWFPVKERSTYCTLFFLIASGISFFIQPIILIVYNSCSNLQYIVDGKAETVFKAFYITSRFFMTTLYIMKVSRLAYAFRIREKNIIYKFFMRERSLILGAIFVSLAISLPLIFTNQAENIVLPIEKGYTNNVQQFWVPVQSIETIIYFTLFYFMKDVTPIYRMNYEIFVMVLSNFVLNIINYCLYAGIGDLHNYCHSSTDYGTYIIFATNQLRTLINVLFCVYIPLKQAQKKPIPLPTEQQLLDTKGHQNESMNFYLIFCLQREEVQEPFRNFLKHMDQEIEKKSIQGQVYTQKLELLTNKYPLIKNIKSFQKLLECYEEISYEQDHGNQVSMQQVVSQYIIDPIQLETFIHNNHENNSQSHSQNNVLSDHTNNATQQLVQSNITSNIIVHNLDQNNQDLILNRRSQQPPLYKRCFSFFKSKNNKYPTHLQIFNLLEYETQKNIEECFNNQNTMQLSDIERQEMLKSSLQKVTDELFVFIHIIWKDFFYLTKSFEFLREIFQHYGLISSQLKAFELESKNMCESLQES